MLAPFGLMSPPPLALGPPCLLDQVGADIAGAYSLRRLRQRYAGAAINLGVGGTSNVLGIGFDADGELDTRRIATACGPGDGLLLDWHDQSVRAQPSLTQGRAKLVSGGVLARLANAAARPAGPGSVMSCPFTLGGRAYALFAVASRTANAGLYARLLSYVGSSANADYDNARSVIFAYAHGLWLTGMQNGDLSGAAVGTEPFQVSSVFDGANHVLTLDGVAGPSVPANGLLDPAGTLGLAQSGAAFWDGLVAELVVVGGAVSAGDQATICADQKRYYGTP